MAPILRGEDASPWEPGTAAAPVVPGAWAVPPCEGGARAVASLLPGKDDVSSGVAAGELHGGSSIDAFSGLAALPVRKPARI